MTFSEYLSIIFFLSYFIFFSFYIYICFEWKFSQLFGKKMFRLCKLHVICGIATNARLGVNFSAYR